MAKLSIKTLKKMTDEELLSFIDNIKILNDSDAYAHYKIILSSSSIKHQLLELQQFARLADMQCHCASEERKIGEGYFDEENFKSASVFFATAIERLKEIKQWQLSSEHQARCIENLVPLLSHQMCVLAYDIEEVLEEESLMGKDRFVLYKKRLTVEFWPVKKEFDDLLAKATNASKRHFTKQIMRLYERNTNRLIERLESDPHSQLNPNFKRLRESGASQMHGFHKQAKHEPKIEANDHTSPGCVMSK